MPGFATSDATKANAWALMNALGIDAREVSIEPLAQRMLEDLNHPAARGEPVYDVAYENVQAGLRTDYLFRLANKEGGFVVGTGDLSRTRARLVHVRRRRSHEPLQRQWRRAEDVDPTSHPLGRRLETVRRATPRRR